jgi:formiminotetrahydrofolate cyclodeaminase
MLTRKTVNEFIDETASGNPTPGGGSIAALSGALGTALTSMVCNLTIGRKKYAEVQKTMEDILRQSENLRDSFARLVDEDAEVFNTVMNALNLPKETEEEKTKRSAAVQHATKNATEIPLRVMQLCEQALILTQTAAQKGNVNSISDAGVAALLLRAACSGAKLNVQINLGSIKDAAFVQETASAAETIDKRVEAMSLDVLKRVYGALSPSHS